MGKSVGSTTLFSFFVPSTCTLQSAIQYYTLPFSFLLFLIGYSIGRWHGWPNGCSRVHRTSRRSYRTHRPLLPYDVVATNILHPFLISTSTGSKVVNRTFFGRRHGRSNGCSRGPRRANRSHRSLLPTVIATSDTFPLSLCSPNTGSNIISNSTFHAILSKTVICVFFIDTHNNILDIHRSQMSPLPTFPFEYSQLIHECRIGIYDWTTSLA
mmetsp:Transcript_15053/g.28614  ORF Transcript_15053/g.28614 Transcript_15053/m.28614 type:complete len:212 (+) Transcript_15053:204-839(+)